MMENRSSACGTSRPGSLRSPPRSRQNVIFLHDIPAYAKSIIAMECLYCIGTASFKFSALLLFHRIFGSVPRFTALLWSLAVLIIANNVAEIFLSVFQCTPVNKA